MTQTSSPRKHKPNNISIRTRRHFCFYVVRCCHTSGKRKRACGLTGEVVVQILHHLAHSRIHPEGCIDAVLPDLRHACTVAVRNAISQNDNFCSFFFSLPVLGRAGKKFMNIPTALTCSTHFEKQFPLCPHPLPHRLLPQVCFSGPFCGPWWSPVAPPLAFSIIILKRASKRLHRK